MEPTTTGAPERGDFKNKQFVPTGNTILSLGFSDTQLSDKPLVLHGQLLLLGLNFKPAVVKFEDVVSQDPQSRCMLQLQLRQPTGEKTRVFQTRITTSIHITFSTPNHIVGKTKTKFTFSIPQK